jgi:hypothetical protein
MSQTFSSHYGNLWVNQQLQRTLIASCADREVFRVVAASFDAEGRSTSSIASLCADCGIDPATGNPLRSRGSFMRSLNNIEKLGLLEIGRRGGGAHWRTLVIKGTGWFDFLRAYRTRSESPMPATPDSTAQDTRLHSAREATPGESDSGLASRPSKDIIPPTPRAAASEPSPSAPVDDLFREVRKAETREPDPVQAPMPDPPIADPAERQADMLDRTPSPDAMRDAWNVACEGTPVPQVFVLSDKRKIALRKAAKLFRDDGIGPWETLVRWIVDQPWCRGEGDRPWVASLDWLVKGDNTLRYMEKVHTEIMRGTHQSRPVNGSGATVVDDDDWPREPEPEVPAWLDAMFNEDGSWKDQTRAGA